MSAVIVPPGIELLGPVGGAASEIVTPEALSFVAKLSRRFEGRRQELLDARARRQKEFDAGVLPDFLPHMREIRESRWSVAPIPRDLEDRRIEITGPTDRKMVINALNSGANVFMADFEDSNTPSWHNMIDGQANLRDAVNRDHLYGFGRKGIPAEQGDSNAPRAAARLAPFRETHAGRWRARLRIDFRFGAVFLP